jgi:hypothetical protein
MASMLSLKLTRSLKNEFCTSRGHHDLIWITKPNLDDIKLNVSTNIESATKIKYFWKWIVLNRKKITYL